MFRRGMFSSRIPPRCRCPPLSVPQVAESHLVLSLCYNQSKLLRRQAFPKSSLSTQNPCRYISAQTSPFAFKGNALFCPRHLFHACFVLLRLAQALSFMRRGHSFAADIFRPIADFFCFPQTYFCRQTRVFLSKPLRKPLKHVCCPPAFVLNLFCMCMLCRSRAS